MNGPFWSGDVQHDIIGGQRAITLRCDLKTPAGRHVCHVHFGLPQPACGNERLVRSPANAPWSPDDGRLGGGDYEGMGGRFLYYTSLRAAGVCVPAHMLF